MEAKKEASIKEKFKSPESPKKSLKKIPPFLKKPLEETSLGSSDARSHYQLSNSGVPQLGLCFNGI